MESIQHPKRNFADPTGSAPGGGSEPADALDPQLSRLERDLDLLLRMPRPPAHLSFAAVEVAHQRRVSRRHAGAAQRPRMSGAPPRPVHRLGRAVAIALVAVLVLSGVAYAGEPLLNRVLRADPGTQQILDSGLFTEVGVSHALGAATVTIERAYADANRVVLGYTLTRAAGVLRSESPTIQLKLGLRDGTLLPERAAAGYASSLPSDVQVVSYDAAAITGSPSLVPLRLTAQASEGGTWTFDFSLPFHAGRVAQPHQRVTAGGGTATLERIVLTPSEMRVYLAGVGEYAITRLSIGGWLDGWDSDHGSVGPVTSWTTDDGQTAISFPAALYQRHGEWTLDVSLDPNIVTARSAHDASPPPPTGGPWKFQFVVP